MEKVNINKIKFNPDTKLFSVINEVRVFSIPDDAKPSNGKKWKFTEWNNKKNDKKLISSYESIAKGTWKSFKDWCSNNGVTPASDNNQPKYSKGGGGGDNGSRNNNNGGVATYTASNPLDTKAIGGSNVFQYGTRKILIDRLNELLKRHKIKTVGVDKDHNCWVEIQKGEETVDEDGNPVYKWNKDSEPIYLAIYVITEGTYAIIKLDYAAGSVSRSPLNLKNAIVAGPKELREIIEKMSRHDHSGLRGIGRSLAELPFEIVERLAGLVADTVKLGWSWVKSLIEKN